MTISKAISFQIAEVKERIRQLHRKRLKYSTTHELISLYAAEEVLLRLRWVKKHVRGKAEGR